jgi:hypothetical protein
MLLSQKRLLQILGALWLIDGLFQLQPQMFTLKMVNGTLSPIVQGQPQPLVVGLKCMIEITTQHLILVNLLIAVIQIVIGASLLLGSRRYPASRLVKGALWISLVWSIIVWFGGEGMSMLLTGQASMLTGAPGAVLFYALLALVLYPRRRQTREGDSCGILSRLQLRWIFAAFWLFAALLQLQPYWWQPGQISQTIGALSGQGGWNSLLVDPPLNWLSHITGNGEIMFNIALILVFLEVGIGLLIARSEHIHPLLALSVALSFAIWWSVEGFGMIFTGMTTDFNSGLLLIVIALACWPRVRLAREKRATFVTQQLASASK